MSLFRQLGLPSQCKIVPVIPIPIILKNGFDQQQFLLKNRIFSSFAGDADLFRFAFEFLRFCLNMLL